MDNLLKWKWVPANPGGSAGGRVRYFNVDNKVKNSKPDKISFNLNDRIKIRDKNVKNIVFTFKGKVHCGAGACIYINNHPVPINSSANMPLLPPVVMKVTLEIMALSEVDIEELTFEVFFETKDFAASFVKNDADVLVVTPLYPSPENMYMCGFVHSRVREYIKQSLKVSVASISDTWYQSVYEINGVRVLKGNHLDLKNIIKNGHFKVVVVHFVDEKIYQILDVCRTTERLVFICHGPETTFEALPNKVRPYFTREIDVSTLASQYSTKKRYVKKYSQDANTTWVFVSKWLKDFSEQLLGFSFLNSTVINNIINENLFPYVPKDPEMRKKILILRKFDNISVHSIDECVFTILELSRRPCFRDLVFNIYGDGPYFEQLLAPLRWFANVKIFRTFVPNEEISALHAQNGILLIPSRHDAHPVSMCEGASSGLVVVGSDVTSNGDFMNQKVNHTLARPEDFIELANIIERLYNNPQEYLEISGRMSSEIRKRCSLSETVSKEVDLINGMMKDEYKMPAVSGKAAGKKPVLTVAVPVYNVARYLEKCLFSLVNHSNINDLEILVVNDGSTDESLDIAKKFKTRFDGLIRIVSKENGGHGSAINVAVAEAGGRYLRLVDGDDYVNSQALSEQIERLKKETADIVLTDAMHDNMDKTELSPVITYNTLREGPLYNFDDLCSPEYGFSGYGPILSTATFKTECLRKPGFKISEKMAYVDMEFNAYSVSGCTTLRYYNLDIYRYLIGRQGQSVSKATWTRKYKEHEKVLFNLVDFVESEKNLSKMKRKYIAEHLVAPMCDSHVFILDQLCKWGELDEFLGKLGKTRYVYSSCVEFINKKNGDCKIILKEYKKKLKPGHSLKKPVPIIGGAKTYPAYMSPKKLIKAVLPYGFVRIYQRYIKKEIQELALRSKK